MNVTWLKLLLAPIMFLLVTRSCLGQVIGQQQVVADSIIRCDFFRHRPAEFPGGLEGMRSYLTAQIHYPERAVADSICGKVLVQFSISEDGSVEGASISQSVAPILDEEALRIVRSMPRWKPAIEDDKPVRSRYILPVNFRLGARCP